MVIKTKPVKKKRYTITVGSNDMDTGIQEQSCIDVIKTVHQCCRESGNNYTTRLVKGGYYHDDGKFVLENSMEICLVDPKEDTIYQIAEKLCNLLHQESVMICVDEVISYYVLGNK